MTPLDDQYFGEGLTRTQDNIVYQLTYKEKKVLVWKLNSDFTKLEFVETKGMP